MAISIERGKALQYVGQPVTRVDALDKVTGKAIYGVDLKLPGMLHAKVLRSTWAHARLVRVDVRRARSLPGVLAAVTGRDFPYLHGETVRDEPFLAVDRVRYVGEPVAAVAAVDVETAEAAVDLIEVEYEPLPAVFDPVQAAGEDAPLLHPELGNYPHGKIILPQAGSNVCHRFKLRRGDVERGFQAADLIFEDTFSTQMVQHAALEPHAAIARFGPGGEVTVWSSNDAPHRTRRELAEALGLPLGKVRIATSGYMGGGFGSKGGLKAEAAAIALASRTRGRPVRLQLDRDEVFSAVLTRVPTVTTIKTGVKRDGRITARQVTSYWDAGAYAEKTPTICRQASQAAAGPYRIPNVWIDARAVYTNKQNSGAMRGYGIPQVAWAHESQMDIIAAELGLDPTEIRLRNGLEEGDLSATGQVMYSVGLKETMGRTTAAMPWEGPAGADGAVARGGGVSRGRGVAWMFKNTKTPSTSSAFVRVDEDLTVTVLSSSVEIGQGNNTILAQIAAEELGVPVEAVRLAAPDTDYTPYDASTTSSRSAFHMGNAVRRAAIDAAGQIRGLAAAELHVHPEQVEVRAGKLAVSGQPEHTIDLGALLRARLRGGGTILGRGTYTPEGATDIDPETGQGAMPSIFWMYATQGVEVEVDRETGQVAVKRVVAAHDVGRALNPLTCCQQIEGGVVMGVGMALSEELRWDERGRLLNANFHDYKLPTAMDIPEIEPLLVETPHPAGPYGAKGLGEPVLSPTAPAVAGAVERATGVRIKDLPLTPEKLWRALRARPEERQQ